jgi:hypothetical protein
MLLTTLALAMDVTVTEDPAKDRWTVTWTTDQPVQGLLFTRNRNPVQADFRPKKGRIVAEDGYQVWLAKKPTTTFTATFDTNTAHQAKDYELNIAFGDGSRLLYTDHLFAVGVVCTDGSTRCSTDDMETLPGEVHRYTFATTPGRQVLTPDGRTPGQATWNQSRGGVYILFGDTEALPDERVTFVMDPTLPAWIRAATARWIGPLLDGYTTRTGRALSFQPTILVSYGTNGDGLGYGGGGLPGQMQLHLEGTGWATETPETAATFAHFLAHETFHMWNGEELSTHVDGSEEWLSEGSAELFAWWAMQDLGLLDADGVLDRVHGAASRCVGDLGAEPLLNAHRSGRYGAFYSCGATELFLLDAALQTKGTYLEAVVQDVFAEGDRYSTYDVLEAAHRLSKDPLLNGPLERTLRHGLGGDALARLETRFTEAGHPTHRVDAWTAADASRDVLHDALVETVARCDCGGAMSVWNKGSVLTFEGLEACDALGTTMDVTHIAGVAVDAKREALAAAWKAIDADGTVVLAGKTEERTVTCVDVPRPQVLARPE